VGEVEEFYGIRIDAPAGQTLDEYLRTALSRRPAHGDTLVSGPLTFVIRELVEDRIETVGLLIEAGR
jgi:NhaP-type Na+/H+ and K+/H+ antiporter